MTKSVRRSIACALALSTVVLLAACAPIPGSSSDGYVELTCDAVTAGENAAATVGSTLEEVQAALGGRELTLVSLSEFQSGNVDYVWSSYAWEQEWDINGCFQYAVYSFENGVLTSKHWSDPMT